MPPSPTTETPLSGGPVVPWSARAWWRVGIPLALFAILWLDLIRQLGYTWETNEQYAYGWFVPILALALFFRRWITRPSPLRLDHGPSPAGAGEGGRRPGEGSREETDTGGEGQGEVSLAQPSAFQRLSISAFVVLLCLLLLPIRVIHEINQDWPLITWPLTAVVVALTLYAVFLAGGWRWVKYFAFPICFILVAVQWPYRIEHGLTQNLMQVVASLTVEILGWFGIPALQRGNLIELSTGVLGVDEACSGIRSFQSTLMVSLFLGELYRLRPAIRLLLVGAGLIAAFLLNIARTLILTWQANAHGLSAIDKWHDPAGFTIAIACFAVLWLLAVLIKRKWSSAAPSPLRLDRGEGQGEVSSGSAADHGNTGTHDDGSSDHRTTGPRDCGTTGPRDHKAEVGSQLSVVVPTRYLVAIGCWALFCLVATEAWYRSNELRRADTAQWWVSYPTNLASFEPANVSKAAAKLLKHDTESSGSWDEPDGTRWSVFCFRWKEGDPTARMSAQAHRPEYCLVGGGHNMIDMTGVQYFGANGIDLPFRPYTFDSREQPLHVFFCLWEDGAETQVGFGKTKQGDRLRTVWAGRRGLGQQTMEIICRGYPDLAAAEKAVRARLPGLIRIGNSRSVANRPVVQQSPNEPHS